MQYQYNKVVIGGTFDHFHQGHELFIKTAVKLGKFLLIGLTTDSMYQKKSLSQTVESYDLRKTVLTNHLYKLGCHNSQIVPLNDSYGSTTTDFSLEAIVVTEANYSVAKEINNIRKRGLLKPLQIEIVPLLKGDDDQVISSERIRLGEINRLGRSYYKLFDGRQKFHLPTNLRDKLRQPFGQVIKNGSNEILAINKEIITTIFKNPPVLIIPIGDIVYYSLLKNDIKPDMAIIDYKSRRKALEAEIHSVVFQDNTQLLPNDPGTINKTVVDKLKKMINKAIKNKEHQRLLIKGEEDLLVIPVILLAPLRSLVIYGQFETGAVLVKVTEEKKEEVKQLLQQFT